MNRLFSDKHATQGGNETTNKMRKQHVVKRIVATLLVAGFMQHAMAANVAPTVSMTAPIANAPFIGPAIVPLSATAADSDGTVSKVVFYKGTTVLATLTAAPYDYSWTNVAAGSYSITAKATDDIGAVTTSAPLIVTVAANQLPSVSITAPAIGAKFIGPATIALASTAADSDGTITKVAYYKGTTLIGSSTTAPYAVNWSNAAAGSYSLTAKATDNKGGVTTSAAVTVVVDADLAPTVVIASPANNATFAAPGVIALTATAADTDGIVSKVAYYNGATLVGSATTAPYAVKWSGVAVGSYSLTAKATDDKGVVTTSAPVNVVVSANVAPTVSLTAPASNASFVAPATISLATTAADSDGTISKVAFYRGTTLIGTATTAPFAFSWTNVAVGSYSLTAKATDDKGAVSTSAAVAITVKANLAPSVAITAPAPNANFVAPATVGLSASASDPDGTVSKVDYFNGATLIGSASTAPFAFNWSGVGAGSYSVTAKATDDKGAVTTSVAFAVTVKANFAPTVSLTAPLSGASYMAPAAIALSATAADSDGSISKVEFYAGAVLIGSATSSPYAVNWANVAAGSYSVTARATDNNGAVTVSAPASISVVANVAPLVSLTATPANASAPATISLTANATDSDGSVAKVEFFNGTTLLATATQAPYTFSWTNVAVGTYAITARATDNANLPTTSAPIQVVVAGPAAQAYYIYSDQINTAREITDSAGVVVWRADTEPFGANPSNENPSGAGAFTYNLRFPGQYFDRESGLHYNYFRDYDPQTGRYVQSDPIGLTGGNNTYAYGLGNPVVNTDSYGLQVLRMPLPVPALPSPGLKPAPSLVDPADKPLPAQAKMIFPPSDTFITSAVLNPTFFPSLVMAVAVACTSSRREECEKGCDKDYDRGRDFCRAMSGMRGRDKETFSQCMDRVDVEYVACHQRCGK
jgi:RHS repeat-associated protein